MLPFPKFEDWQAPWERSGKELDPAKVKGLVYSLSKEVAEGKEKHEAALTSVTTERDTLKAKVEEHETKDLSEVDRLKRENEKLKEQRQQVKDKPDAVNLDVVRLELALEHGLTKAQAKRLVGGSAEDLAADAKEYAKELGTKGAEGDAKPPSSSRSSAKNLRSGLGDDNDTDAMTPAAALELLPPRR